MTKILNDFLIFAGATALVTGIVLAAATLLIWSGRHEKVSEYLSHVEECRALARHARSPQDREMLLNMAATWESLAEAREKQLNKKASVEE